APMSDEVPSTSVSAGSPASISGLATGVGHRSAVRQSPGHPTRSGSPRSTLFVLDSVPLYVPTLPSNQSYVMTGATAGTSTIAFAPAPTNTSFPNTTAGEATLDAKIAGPGGSRKSLFSIVHEPAEGFTPPSPTNTLFSTVPPDGPTIA